MSFEEKIFFNKQLYYGQRQLFSFTLDAIKCKFTQKNPKFTERPTTFFMDVKRLRALCIELYKVINNLSPDFMRKLFKSRLTNRHDCEKYKMNMIIPDFNQVFYGKKSLRIFDPKL